MTLHTLLIIWLAPQIIFGIYTLLHIAFPGLNRVDRRVFKALRLAR